MPFIKQKISFRSTNYKILYIIIIKNPNRWNDCTRVSMY